MNKEPLVSIGVPVFNRGDELKECLTALLTQSYQNIEICISDNGSTDDSAAIARHFEKQDKRVFVNEYKENRGIVENFKMVLKMAHGRYFIWAGSDDKWHRNFIAELVNELQQNPGATSAMCSTERVYEDGKRIAPIYYKNEYNPNNMGPLALVRSLLTTSTHLRKKKLNLFLCGLFRRDILEQVMADCPVANFRSDRIILTIVALSGTGFRYVEKTLFTKKIHRKSFSERNPNDSFSQSKNSILFGPLANTWIVTLWILSSRTIPLYRKFYIPLIVIPRMVWWFYQACMICSPVWLRNMLGRGYIKE